MSLSTVKYTLKSDVKPIAMQGTDAGNPMVTVKTIEFHATTYKQMDYYSRCQQLFNTLIDTINELQAKLAQSQPAQVVVEEPEAKKPASKKVEKAPTDEERIKAMVDDVRGLLDLLLAKDPLFLSEVIGVLNEQLTKENNNPNDKKLITFNGSTRLSTGSLDGILEEVPVWEVKELVTYFLAYVPLTSSVGR
jgi:hypothetical protein